ncbi:SLC35A4 upstream open reading frame protein-like isoform X1 [Carassius carassius]|uniref:SLC35A4 upstream open reading frame protein-like isoform X1 n=1 Tax=Carassius carassius TaxID=217509 RepID=UPI002868E2E6|nr:SLC35A4 upstream open reading frame protein-like isoform X1 [Carassius carassius]
MAEDKDPVTRLKDLAQLKDQLEEIQKKVENEVQAGIPQGGSVLQSPLLKGFLAGYVISKLRSSAVLGVALGTLTGIYAAQSYQHHSGAPSLLNQTLELDQTVFRGLYVRVDLDRFDEKWALSRTAKLIETISKLQ